MSILCFLMDKTEISPSPSTLKFSNPPPPPGNPEIPPVQKRLNSTLVLHFLGGGGVNFFNQKVMQLIFSEDLSPTFLSEIHSMLQLKINLKKLRASRNLQIHWYLTKIPYRRYLDSWFRVHACMLQRSHNEKEFTSIKEKGRSHLVWLKV